MSTERLSGFEDGWRFIAKRFLRVFLGYWPVLVLWLVATGIVYSDIGAQRLLISFFLVSGNMNDYIFPVAWTLYYELAFYTLFFFLIVFFQGRDSFLLFK